MQDQEQDFGYSRFTRVLLLLVATKYHQQIMHDILDLSSPAESSYMPL